MHPRWRLGASDTLAAFLAIIETKRGKCTWLAHQPALSCAPQHCATIDARPLCALLSHLLVVLGDSSSSIFVSCSKKVGLVTALLLGDCLGG